MQNSPDRLRGRGDPPTPTPIFEHSPKNGKPWSSGRVCLPRLHLEAGDPVPLPNNPKKQTNNKIIILAVIQPASESQSKQKGPRLPKQPHTHTHSLGGAAPKKNKKEWFSLWFPFKPAKKGVPSKKRNTPPLKKKERVVFLLVYLQTYYNRGYPTTTKNTL